MAFKTLEDIFKAAKNAGDQAKDGHIPHAFHRHGEITRDEHRMLTPDANETISMDTYKAVAYGYVKAGDDLVPKTSKANRSLIHAMRHAVGTRIMNDIGAHESEPVIPLFHDKSKGVY